MRRNKHKNKTKSAVGNEIENC